MERIDVEEAVQQLITGFETLQDQYQKLFAQHDTIKTKLATAREQYNELSKYCDRSTSNTPPLSLSSTSAANNKSAAVPPSASEILDLCSELDAARVLRTAISASEKLRQWPQKMSGVRIWSGPSADQSVASPMLPSISESPMEQDFTIEGTPSRLGCPFASMAGKKLSSHAASVLSRYNGSQGAKEGVSSPRESGSAVGSAISRCNGRESLSVRLANSKRRSSFVDPIKAETCGLEQQAVDEPKLEPLVPENTDVGVCPIRFLDDHSPEEIATYFEKHKHELPRSHQVCVQRYQSNEEQVRELDARYSDVAQMIRGLGEKHIGFMPKEPEGSYIGDDGEEQQQHDSERVRNWASSISAQVPADAQLQISDIASPDAKLEQEETRESHFARPLREVRVGESPSRPWGISVPAHYLDGEASKTNGKPADVKVPAHEDVKTDDKAAPTAARCPFASMAAAPKTGDAAMHDAGDAAHVAPHPIKSSPPEPRPAQKPTIEKHEDKDHPRVVITGPVFIGYNAEDAAKFLREAGIGNRP